ncbi:MAG: MBL fold metallo-hydrolase [Desulfobulbaceae bacterium]|nr:MBL fold metallo-hydrolase [Desulfobulbaceae bacterium]
MDKSYQVMPDIEVLPSFFPIPGAGFLAVNAFVIKAKEPVLVDTGMGIGSEAFMKALESVIDPRDLRWMWITHDDADHTGSIRKVLEAAPKARLAANALAVLRMSTNWQVPMNRVHWLNPGDSISAGDRTLTAVRPPLFDNPTTIGIYDSKSEVFFSADFFGGIIPMPVQNGDDIAEEDLTQGIMSWASADSPWIHMVGPGEFNRSLDRIRKFAPKMFLSSHLPVTRRKPGQLLDLLATLPASPPFVAPDQTALEQILAGQE